MLSCCITWHMPTCTLSNQSVSVEKVMGGTVTTAHSCTWTVGPSVTCKTKQNPLRNKVTIYWSSQETETQLCGNVTQKNYNVCTHVHVCVCPCVPVLAWQHWCPPMSASHRRAGFHSFKFCTENFEEATTTNSDYFYCISEEHCEEWRVEYYTINDAAQLTTFNLIHYPHFPLISPHFKRGDYSLISLTHTGLNLGFIIKIINL